MKKILIILALLMAFPAYADECSKTRYLGIESTKEIKRESYSNREKVKRSFWIFQNGDLLVLNQHHCINSNYEISYSFKASSNQSYKEYADKFLNIMDKIIKFEGLVKKKGFDKNFVKGLKTGKFIKNDLFIEKIKNNEFVEYKFLINKSYSALYDNQVYMYIGIGGDH